MAGETFDLTGRVAVVTGAAAGLGRAIAVGLAQHGADVTCADICSEEALAPVVQEIAALGRKATGVHCDIAVAADVEHLFAELDRTFGRVDILINNAAVPSHAHPADITLEEWRHVLDVNVTGNFLCAQQAGRRMIAQGGGGSIVNISSIAGSTAMGRGNLAYSVSKGAINQLTRELAIEWAQYNIRVNAIQPCQFMTPALRELIDNPAFDPAALQQRFLRGIPLQRIGQPEEIVGPVLFLVSPAAAMITGVLLPVDGGNLAMNAGGSLTW